MTKTLGEKLYEAEYGRTGVNMWPGLTEETRNRIDAMAARFVASLSPDETATATIELKGLRDVFERPFDGEDDPRIQCARVLTRKEAEAILEFRGDIAATLSDPATIEGLRAEIAAFGDFQNEHANLTTAWRESEHECEVLRAENERLREALPGDVVRLVVAAREVFDCFLPEDEEETDRAQALDEALEAFAARVPYENEPDEFQSREVG